MAYYERLCTEITFPCAISCGPSRSEKIAPGTIDSWGARGFIESVMMLWRVEGSNPSTSSTYASQYAPLPSRAGMAGNQIPGRKPAKIR